MHLNSTSPIKEKKLDLVEELVQEKEKLLAEVTKDKNLEEVSQSKALKVDRCHFIEDYRKEDLIQ